MDDKKYLKKKLSKQKFQIVREQAHFLKWLEGRICVKKGSIYSVLYEFKKGKISISQIKITPEILVSTDKAIKILSKFYRVTPKLYGKNFLKEKIKKYEEIKKFLNVSILKKGFEALEFKTLLFITPYFHPPPDTILKKVKKEGIPEINLNNIPEKSRKLFYYLEGCLKISRANSLENRYGIKFPFVKDPILLIELSNFFDEKTIEKLVKILNSNKIFLHELIWEIIYKDFSIEKLKYVIDHSEILNNVEELSLYIPFIKNIKIIKKILEINSFKEKEIKEFVEKVPFDKLINSINENDLLEILSIYKRDEFIKGMRGCLSEWYKECHLRNIHNYNPVKSIIFTDTEQTVPLLEKFKKFKPYVFAFHDLQDFYHFINFWQKNKNNIFKKLHPIIVFWLYKNFGYREIEEIFEGFINVYSGIDSNYLYSHLLFSFFHICKNKYFLRSNYTNLPEIKKKILEMCDRILSIYEKDKEIYKTLEIIFRNSDKIINRILLLFDKELDGIFYYFPLHHLVLLSYLLSLNSPDFFTECFFRILNIYKDEPWDLKEKHAREILRIIKSNVPLKFYNLLQDSFSKSPRKTIKILIDFLRISKHTNTVKKIHEFVKNFQEEIEFKIKKKEDFERELYYLKKLENKTEKIMKRIKNLEKTIQNYESYREKSIEKERRKFKEKFTYKFIKEFENFVNDLYLKAFHGDPIHKKKISKDIREAVYFYLSLKYNKRKAREAINHIIKGDYRKWFLNLEKNKKFIEKLYKKGINTEPLINGFSLNIDNFLLYIETDPLKVLLMGELFKTCLSITGFSNYAVVPYLVDINKKVIYMKDKNNKIIARARLDISDKGYVKMMRIYSNTQVEKIEVYFKKFINEFLKMTGLKRGDKGNFKSLHNLHEAQLEYKVYEKKSLERIRLEINDIEKMKKLHINEVYDLLQNISYYQSISEFLNNIEKILNHLFESEFSFEHLKIIFSILHIIIHNLSYYKYLSYYGFHIEKKIKSICFKSFWILLYTDLNNILPEELIKNNFFYYMKIPYSQIVNYIKKLGAGFHKEIPYFPIKFTFFILKNLNENMLNHMENLIEKKEVENIRGFSFKTEKKEFYRISQIFFFELISMFKNMKITRREFYKFLKGYYLIFKFQFNNDDWEYVTKKLKEIYLKVIREVRLKKTTEEFLKIVCDKIFKIKSNR